MYNIKELFHNLYNICLSTEYLESFEYFLRSKTVIMFGKYLKF